MRDSRAFVLDKDKVDEFLSQKADKKAIDRIYKNADKFERNYCEWNVLHEGCFIQNPHTKRLFSNEESMQNVYCNTCGKKIRKVI